MFRFMRSAPAARAGLVLMLASTIGANALAQSPHIPGRLLVQFSPKATAQQVRNVLATVNARITATIPQIGLHLVQLPRGANEKAAKSAFARRPEVVFAELDMIKAPAQSGSVTPNDPWYSSAYGWHLRKIGCPTAWASTTGSSSITIAVIDTGVNGAHVDLAGKMVPGWNFYDNNSDTSDVAGHGTPVAGIAAASSNNGTGVAAIAWGCKIMPIRISDLNGYATYSAMASGLTYAADHGARVANISYTCSDSVAVTSAAQYFQSKGGIVTVAAGNETAFDATADNPYVLNVSATDSNDVLCTWSNTGNNVDISAPGTNLATTDRNGSYSAASGTSAAAPVVAGVAALVLSVNPALSPTQVQDLLKRTSDDLGPAGWDPSYGAGRVNAANAVAAASGTQQLVNNAPTVSKPAAASANPVTGKSVTLSVLGADDGGESALTYTWSAIGPAAVSFSANGSNAAKNTTVTFTQAGTYSFTASIADASGLSVTGAVSVTVNQTISSIVVSPSSSSVIVNQSQQFSASLKDQFGAAILNPPAVVWSVSGGGVITSSGLFTAGSTAGGPYTVTATAGVVGTASITVASPPDTTAPTVSITSPTGGTVTGTLAVTATASDNVGVVRVELWIDNKLFATDTGSPWGFSVNTKSWKSRTSHTLVCKAYDAAGNVGVSAPVTVSK